MIMGNIVEGVGVNDIIAAIGIYKPGQDRGEWVGADLSMCFTRNVDWYYLIAASRGNRTYCVPDRLDLMLLNDRERLEFEITLADAVDNYEAIIETFKILENFPRFNDDTNFQNDFRHLVTTKAWFAQAYKKIPNGRVVLKCSPAMWKSTKNGIKKWNKPDKLYWGYLQLGEKCQDAMDSNASIDKFACNLGYYDTQNIFEGAELVED